MVDRDVALRKLAADFDRYRDAVVAYLKELKK